MDLYLNMIESQDNYVYTDTIILNNGPKLVLQTLTRHDII